MKEVEKRPLQKERLVKKPMRRVSAGATRAAEDAEARRR